MPASTRRHPLDPKVQDKKPQFQYNLYQECGFLCLVSGCRPDPSTLRCDAARSVCERTQTQAVTYRTRVEQRAGACAPRHHLDPTTPLKEWTANTKASDREYQSAASRRPAPT
eukprot:2775802-Rhodomonas_salina.1